MISRVLDKFKNRLQSYRDKKDLSDSSSVNLDGLELVCFFSGPYRNLTSLTAAMAVLHPNCQVLNHAQSRIFPYNEVNFFKNYSHERFNSFVKYAIWLSLSGFRGRLGGSILLSHAFDKSLVKSKYEERFDDNLLKDNIKCLLWKEGLHLKNHLLKYNVTELDLIQKNDKIRFILPIRNPLDCTFSNQKTGMSNIFNNINKDSTFHEILKSILDEFLSFFQNQKELNSNFFHFYQHTFNEDTLKQFCVYMNLPFDQKWSLDVLEIYNIKSSYNHSKQDIAFYKKYVKHNFKDFPDEMKNLLKFVE